MCGIGSWMAVAECENVAGPTDATITTEVPHFSRLIFRKISRFLFQEPCDDVLDDCADLAEDSCYESWVATNCPKSCGLCSGKKIWIFMLSPKW